MADGATVVEETAGPLSPLVRKMARENNIDLSKVKGTGIGGRITKLDLESYLNGQAGSAVAPQAPAAQPAAAPPAPPNAPVAPMAPAVREAAPAPSAPVSNSVAVQSAMPGAPAAMRV
jgi:pyruvate dehydrogenase E2 component (dihydrolipoamide acetyltransferase)